MYKKAPCDFPDCPHFGPDDDHDNRACPSFWERRNESEKKKPVEDTEFNHNYSFKDAIEAADDEMDLN